MAIALLSLGLTFGCITLVLGPAILMELVSKKHQGKIQGWFMAFTSLGGIAGPYVTGYLFKILQANVQDFITLLWCIVILILEDSYGQLSVRRNRKCHLQHKIYRKRFNRISEKGYLCKSKLCVKFEYLPYNIE